jgi:hypothetical protein
MNYNKVIINEIVSYEQLIDYLKSQKKIIINSTPTQKENLFYKKFKETQKENNE